MSENKADLLTRLRKVEPDKPGERTRWYRNPDGPEAAAEIERLREAIRRLADQDATLSVCDGNVTVTMDATLTDEEREAVRLCAGYLAVNERPDLEATLRGLLERTQATHATPDEGSVPERGTIADEPPPDPERLSRTE